MIKTSFTDLFQIDHPIVQGGMQWVGRAELVSAVANAGALGFLTALTQPTPTDLRHEIERCRKLTSRPFGVNLTLLPTINPVPYDEYIQVIIDSGITIVETAGGNPERYIDKLKKADLKVLHKCTGVRYALKAERLGVDAISIDGFECAGHTGEDDVPNLILVPVTADKLKIPFIASGGFADGRGLAAALALGAGGINMGTRFLATVEAPVHENVKRQLLSASELDTTLILRSLKNTMRTFKNEIANKVVEIERSPTTTFQDVRDYVAGVKGRKVYEQGEMDAGIWTVGLSQALIADVPTVAALIARVMSEAEHIIGRRLADMLRVDGKSESAKSSYQYAH